MKDIRRYMGWLLVILPFHGIEQFMTGFDELYELQGQLGAIIGLFPSRDAGIVFLVFALVMLVGTFLYCTLRNDRSRLIEFGFFGLSGVIEAHHIIKTAVHLDYFPGAITAIPFVLVGGLLLRAVLRVWRTVRVIPATAGSMAHQV